MYRIGIDVGGTFTDFTLLDETKGALHYHKVPSTTVEPSEAVDMGLSELIKEFNIDPSKINYLGHGTTVALNMLLEHRARGIGLLTTKGFRDILEIARQTRPHLYNYTLKRTPTLARRAHRFEIPERIGVDGKIVTPLDHAAVERAAQKLKDARIQAIAIVFLHAYQYPEHEKKALEIVQNIIPDAFISISSEVLPEFREFERTSTTAVNAYVGPRMKSYLNKLESRMESTGIMQSPHIIHSNGGLLTLRTAMRFPVRTCLSGPAAGVVGAAAVANAANEPDILTFDVGGTSTDVSLVLDGKPLFSSERSVGGHPVKSPAVDVNAIGAGGGSIAWIDGGGALKVGPQSAGANPGPISYGNGGKDVTLTDANVVLGRLNPKTLLGGRMQINAKAAHTQIESTIASPLGLSVEEAAVGIIRVTASGIARAIRSMASGKGHNPLKLSLFAYGGAGPLLAGDVNEEVGCLKILIPEEPGTLCARGILLSDFTFDFVRTLLSNANGKGWRRVQEVFRELESQANNWLNNDNVARTDRAFRRFVEARYEGQSFEIRVEFDKPISNLSLIDFIKAFHLEHKFQFGYDIENRTVEIINCRLEAIGKTPKPTLKPFIQPNRTHHILEKRPVYISRTNGWQETIVHKRLQLTQGQNIEGPAIVEEMSSTTFIPLGYLARIDKIGNLVLERIE